jgi:predicted TIM-barrel fold metal-dependent hydrolase
MKEVLRRRADDEQGVALSSGLLERIVAHRLNDPWCDELLTQMDAAGIARCVLLIADLAYDEDPGERALQRMYEHYRTILLAHPDRFIVFGGTDPRRGDRALNLFERGVREYGFRGLKLYPPCGYEIDDPALMNYYELCAAHKIPVLVHTGPSLPSMSGDKGYPQSILRTAQRFPSVQFVLGHGAFQNPQVNIPLGRACRNVYLEASGFQRLLERPDEVRGRLRELFHQIPDQVVFGTDWPVFNLFGSQQDWVRYFQDSDLLTPIEAERFFWRNAEALFPAVS